MGFSGAGREGGWLEWDPTSTGEGRWSVRLRTLSSHPQFAPKCLWHWQTLKRGRESLCRRDRQCLSELTPCRLCHLHTGLSVWLIPLHECLCDLFWFLFNTQFKLVKGLITEVYFCVYLWLWTPEPMHFSLPPLLLVASWTFYEHIFN